MNHFEDRLKSTWKTFLEVFDPRQESWFEFPELEGKMEIVSDSFTSSATKMDDNEEQEERTKNKDNRDCEEGKQKGDDDAKNTGLEPELQNDSQLSSNEDTSSSSSPPPPPSSSSSWNYHDNFAPISRPLLIFKICYFCLSLVVFLNAFTLVPGPFFLAYFTYWGVSVNTLYAGISLLCSIFRWWSQHLEAATTGVNVNADFTGITTTSSKTITTFTPKNHANEVGNISETVSSPPSLSSSSVLSSCPMPFNSTAVVVLPRRYKVSWIMLTITLHTTFLAMVVYWPWILLNWQMEGQQHHKKKWYNIAAHGGLFVLAMIDGFVANKIPLKWLHWLWAVVPFEIIYIFWTLVHSFWTDIGNPETNDDAIYPGILEWQNDPTWWCIVTAFLLLLVIGPIMFAILRWISLYRFSSNNRGSGDCGRKEVDPKQQRKRILLRRSTTVTVVSDTSTVNNV